MITLVLEKFLRNEGETGGKLVFLKIPIWSHLKNQESHWYDTDYFQRRQSCINKVYINNREETMLKKMIAEYSEDIYPYATFQLEESVPPGGDSRCNSAAPLQTFVYHDPRLSTADTLQLREVSSNVQFAFVIHHRFPPFAIRVCSPNHGKTHLRTPHASSNSSSQFTTVCIIARDRSSYRCNVFAP